MSDPHTTHVETPSIAKGEESPKASSAEEDQSPKPAIQTEEVPQARSLEEGLAAAGNYEGDPLDCPCIQHMKEGKIGNTASSKRFSVLIFFIFRPMWPPVCGGLPLFY
jgi:hypothetical protein